MRTPRPAARLWAVLLALSVPASAAVVKGLPGEAPAPATAQAPAVAPLPQATAPALIGGGQAPLHELPAALAEAPSGAPAVQTVPSQPAVGPLRWSPAASAAIQAFRESLDRAPEREAPESAASRLAALYAEALPGIEPLAVEAGRDETRAALMEGGFGRLEASLLSARVRERSRRLAAHRGTYPVPERVPSALDNPFLLTVLLGVRPSTLLYIPRQDARPLIAAMSSVNRRLRMITEMNRKTDYGRTFVYDPDLARSAMRTATASGIPQLSFAGELALLDGGPLAQSRFEARVRRMMREYFDEPSRHRMGVLFGYPINDVAEMAIAEEEGRLDCLGGGCVSIPFQGDPNNAMFWMTPDPGHPLTRRMAALYRAALDLYAAVLSKLREP